MVALGLGAMVALVALAFASLEGGGLDFQILPSGSQRESEEEILPEDVRVNAPSAIMQALSVDAGIL